LAVGWHAVRISGIQANDSALVLGGGPIGISVIQTLRCLSVPLIIVSEIASKRKEFSKSFGAHHILDPSSEDIAKRCQELTQGKGVGFVFDAAGVQAGVDGAVAALGVRGTLVNIAIWEGELKIVPNNWVFKERRWVTSATYAGDDYKEVIEAIASGEFTLNLSLTL
jgi:threonine dehydrogenase-like Zn-dependent dehydrogenase